MIVHPRRTGSCIMLPRRAVSCVLKLNPPARIGKNSPPPQTSDARYPEIPHIPTRGGEDERGRTSTGRGGDPHDREDVISKSDRRRESA